jgi:hypothetical protein
MQRRFVATTPKSFFYFAAPFPLYLVLLPLFSGEYVNAFLPHCCTGKRKRKRKKKSANYQVPLE